MNAKHWPPVPYGGGRRRQGQTTNRAAQIAALRALERFTKADVRRGSAYLPKVFFSVVIHITSHSQVYDSLNASRISKISGVNVRETRRALKELNTLGLLDWQPGQGNRWGLQTLARVSVLTGEELGHFLTLEGCVQTPLATAVEGCVHTHLEGCVDTLNGVVRNTPYFSTEENLDAVFDSSSLQHEGVGESETLPLADKNKPLPRTDASKETPEVAARSFGEPEPAQAGRPLGWDIEW